jgi:oligoribonuclease NrnB/cAMP/cGMP phosphodiesterase (DHH superfamily)
MSSNIHVFTHNDLDGIGSLLTVIWAFPDSTITYTCISAASSFASQFAKATEHKKLSAYDKVFVLDLSINKEDVCLIDKSNVVYVDHHKSSLNLTFNSAKSFVKVFSSCILLLTKLLKSQLHLSTSQKQLIVYIDDYDSYQLNFNNSKLLNTLFWAHYLNQTSLFIKDFIGGFNRFTSLQETAILLQNKKIKEEIDKLEVYETFATVQGTEQKIIAAFASLGINEVAAYLLNKYRCEIVLVINIKSERVSFRRSAQSKADMALLAQNLCGGKGHESAAGGALTENFLAFTKLFKPIV